MPEIILPNLDPPPANWAGADHPAFVAHKWKPGQSGNPGGKPAALFNGRHKALRLLDEILAEETTLAKMRTALRAYIHKRPVAAFKTLVMPLLPKEARLELGEEGMTIVWKSLCSTDPTPDSNPSMMIDVDSGSSAPDAGGARQGSPPPSLSTAPDTKLPATTDGSRPPT